MEEISFKERLIKNVGYNIIKSVVNKIGGLIFTLLIARLLLPELFGLYSIALSVVILFSTFTDLGISTVLIRYISYSLTRHDQSKARQYFRFFLKIKVSFLLISLILLVILAKPLANYFFLKPELFSIFLFSLLYLVISQLECFLESLFYVHKEIKYNLITEIILQVSRILFTVTVFYLLSGSNIISGIFVGLALSYLIMLIFSSIYLVKKYDYILGKIKHYTIDKKQALKFLGFMTVSTISVTLFASVDTLVLGRFISSQGVGYYKAAISIITALASLLSIVLVLFPLFTELDKRKLKLLVASVVNYIFIFSIPMFIGIIVFGTYAIRIALGSSYLSSIYPLYFLSPLLVIIPLIGVYHTILQAKGMAKASAIVVLISLAVNICLTLGLVLLFLPYGESYAIAAAAVGVALSQLVLLLLSLKFTKKYLGFGLMKSAIMPFVKSLFSSLIMGIIIFVYLRFVSSSLLALIGILVGTVVYFLVMYLVKGIKLEDIDNIKLMFKSR